jgi:hypothetical protein
MSKVCPCCGQTLPPPADKQSIAGLTSQQRLIYIFVNRAGSLGVPTDDLIGLLYSGCSEPADARKVLRTQVCLLNRKIKALSKRIHSVGFQSGPGGHGRVGCGNYVCEDL